MNRSSAGGSWRTLTFLVLLAIAGALAFAGMAQMWKRINKQIRWGDTVAVRDDAPQDFGPGTSGVVRDIRYLGKTRACLVDFGEGRLNVVPDEWLELRAPGDVPPPRA